MASVLLASLLLAVSFIPPILLAIRLRAAERSRREPWSALVKAFLWGAVGATLLAIVAESFLSRVLGGDALLFGIVPAMAIVIAPVVEEVAKSVGLLGIRDLDPEPEDGLIYGAFAGMGFAATENLAYIGGAYLLGGSELAIATAVYRGIATVALHAAATALTGYGIWAARFHIVQGSWLGGLLAAVVLHALYNALASVAAVWATIAALALGIVAYSQLVKRVRRLDALG